MNAGFEFFATNRSMENLSQIESDTNRDARINLQRGGYYFVNMHRYMPYFYSEVDNSFMPKEGIVMESDREVFAEFLARPNVDHVVICVHGFNVHLQAAHAWFRILTESMRNVGYRDSFVVSRADPAFANNPQHPLTAFIGFSWPSNGSVLSYNRDQLDAAGSGQALAALIGRIKAYDKKVSLLCHSMGNYAACSMLASLVNEVFVPNSITREYIASKRPDLKKADQAALAEKVLKSTRRGDDVRNEQVYRTDHFIQRYVMIAPDVERRHIGKGITRDPAKSYIGPFYSGLQHLVAEAVNVYSRFDSALNVSIIEKKPKSAVLAVGDAIAGASFGLLDFLERNPDYKWEMRLGSSAHPTSAPPNVRSINATELAGRPIDHSDHIDSTPVVAAIAQALGLVPPPAATA